MEYDALWTQTNGYITLRVYRIYSNISEEDRYQVRLFGVGSRTGYPIYRGSVIREVGSLEDAKHWALNYLGRNTYAHAASPLRARGTCGARLAEFENSSQVKKEV